MRQDFSSDKKFDLCTFGFEVSLELLKSKADFLEKNAVVIVPLSEENDEGQLLSLEQDFCVLKYLGAKEFEVVETIMKTAFARRIDELREVDESMDADFYNNHQRFTKIQLLEQKVSELEANFKQAVAENKTIELKELMAQEGTK